MPRWQDCPALSPCVQIPQGDWAPHDKAPQPALRYSPAKNPQMRARKRQQAQSLSKRATLGLGDGLKNPAGP